MRSTGMGQPIPVSSLFRIEKRDEIQYTRAAYHRETVEETAFRHIEHEKLYAAMKRLPERQYRRLVLYYFGEFTYEQIAKMERCSHPAIIKSIKAAIEALKKYFSE